MKGWKNKTRKNNQNKKSSRRFFVFTFLSLLFKFSVHLTGADPGFFLGGGALVSCSSSTPINHIVFFFCRIPVVLENRRSSQEEGGGAHPLHPPPRPAPDLSIFKILSISLAALEQHDSCISSPSICLFLYSRIFASNSRLLELFSISF